MSKSYMTALVANYENGNLSDARNQAVKRSGLAIATALVARGYSENKARLVARWLKTGEGWQAACDAK